MLALCMQIARKLCHVYSPDIPSLQLLEGNLGNFVIAVNGDEKVDLENTQLYQKASRSSLT